VVVGSMDGARSQVQQAAWFGRLQGPDEQRWTRCAGHAWQVGGHSLEPLCFCRFTASTAGFRGACTPTARYAS
jgi:hypothetical protein